MFFHSNSSYFLFLICHLCVGRVSHIRVIINKRPISILASLDGKTHRESIKLEYVKQMSLFIVKLLATVWVQIMELPETWKMGKKGTYHHHDGLLDLESKGEEKRRCNRNKDCYKKNLLPVWSKLVPNKTLHLENGCLLSFLLLFKHCTCVPPKEIKSTPFCCL